MKRKTRRIAGDASNAPQQYDAAGHVVVQRKRGGKQRTDNADDAAWPVDPFDVQTEVT